MAWSEQKLDNSPRYTVVPRALVFLTHDDDVLLIRGTPTKRLWPNKLNGIGGHIEPGETPLQGAKREVVEETGLTVQELELRAAVHIQGDSGDGRLRAGVMMFVYVGQAPERNVRAGDEGTLEWCSQDAVLAGSQPDLVPDLPHLLSRILHDGAASGVLHGHYRPAPDGHTEFSYELM